MTTSSQIEKLSGEVLGYLKNYVNVCVAFYLEFVLFYWEFDGPTDAYTVSSIHSYGMWGLFNKKRSSQVYTFVWNFIQETTFCLSKLFFITTNGTQCMTVRNKYEFYVKNSFQDSKFYTRYCPLKKIVSAVDISSIF